MWATVCPAFHVSRNLWAKSPTFPSVCLRSVWSTESALITCQKGPWMCWLYCFTLNWVKPGLDVFFFFLFFFSFLCNPDFPCQETTLITQQLVMNFSSVCDLFCFFSFPSLPHPPPHRSTFPPFPLLLRKLVDVSGEVLQELPFTSLVWTRFVLRWLCGWQDVKIRELTD